MIVLLFMFAVLRNAYGQFVQEKYHEITVGDNSKERMKELSRIWKSMSLNEQQVILKYLIL